MAGILFFIFVSCEPLNHTSHPFECLTLIKCEDNLHVMRLQDRQPMPNCSPTSTHELFNDWSGSVGISIKYSFCETENCFCF